ncbi:MAG: hypothetical protein ACFHU9_05935 [Fluviicola sp.]
MNSLKLLLTFLALSLFLTWCCNPNEVKKAEVHSKPMTQKSSVERELYPSELDTEDMKAMGVDYCIDIIASNNQVHSAHVGSTGVKSDTYKAYECLASNHSISELLPLLQHDSTAVRVYAYHAIVKKDSTYADRAWKELKGKDDEVTTFSGCIMMTMPIRQSMNF